MVAENIGEYLKENGIKQTWLSEQIGVPNTTFNGILNGRTELKADMFIRICKVLNVSPETFAERGKE